MGRGRLTISPLIGNSRAVSAVQRALASGSPPHAWLFTGPEAVGKATVARWTAQAVNCERTMVGRGSVGPQHRDNIPMPNGDPSQGMSADTDGVTNAAPINPGVEPCGGCNQCTRIARGIHSDVITVSIPPTEPGEPLHKDISVEQVREVEQGVMLAPFEGRTRVVIIDPADAMSGGAQNAFLKTLEEPPPNAAFVLIATRPDDLLPTVRSRCRRIEFGLVAAEEIDRALNERGTDSENARLLSRLAEGRPGRALALAHDPKRLAKRRELLEEASDLGDMSTGDLMERIERMAAQFRERREAVFDRLSAWLSWWRDVLLSQSGAEESIANIDLIDKLREDAAAYERADVLAFVQALLKCRERLEANVQARIAMDAMIVLTPRPRGSRLVKT
jgi:DNA polymerase III subunit delta'